MNQLLFGFNVCMFFWLFGTFMMFALRDNEVAAVFWDRFIYVGVVFMPAFMHHFSLLFTGRVGQQKVLLWINYFLAFVFLFLSRTPYFVDGLYYYSWGVHSQAKILHTIFMVYFFGMEVVAGANLWRYYQMAKEKTLRAQIIYVALSFSIVIFIGGLTYLFAYGVDTKFPFTYVTGLIFPLMLFYALGKHHLFGTKVIVTEILVGLAEFFMVMQIFFSQTVLDVIIRTVFSIIVALFGVLLIRSVHTEIQRREEVTALAHSLEKANLRLQELDRQKTDFLSIASHQLRTPLSILKGYIELIKDGGYGKPTKGIVETLNSMDSSNEHLIKLVDEFLNISRIEQGRTKFVFKEDDIFAVVEDVKKELELRAKEKKLGLVSLHKGATTLIIMDAEKVRHVVFNFVDNAIKYSEKGKIIISVEDEDNGTTVRVCDQGIGFNKVDAANFFQKFYRGDNVKGTNVNGTGLGLYVCRKFIEAHGGKVWAHSPGLGQGGEFGFWLPMKMAAPIANS
jgi:signal transduction histidine kinase